MKRVIYIIALMFVLLCCVSCNGVQEDDGLSIVTTAFPHYDFARSLTEGAEDVKIKMLLSPGSEVHTYEPTPSDLLCISGADLFIYTGGESEAWADKILDGANRDSLSKVSLLSACGVKKQKEHDSEYDEHVWTSVKNAKKIVDEIYDALCKQSPDNIQLFTDNYNRLQSELDEINSDFEAVMRDKKRSFIVVADRFPFLHMAKEYGFEYYAAFDGCSSATEPSVANIASLSQMVKNENVPYVFTIEFSNGKIAQNVTAGSNAGILKIQSCHNITLEEFEGGVTYTQLMKQNAENLRRAMCE